VHCASPPALIRADLLTTRYPIIQMPLCRRILLVIFLALVSAARAEDKAALSPTVPALPLTLTGTWEALNCRRGVEPPEGTFLLNVNSRRRIAGWFTNSVDATAMPVAGQISRRGVVTGRVKRGLVLRGIVSGTTNPAIHGTFSGRCVGTFASFPPLPPSNTNSCVANYCATNCCMTNCCATNDCVVLTNTPSLFADTNLANNVARTLGKPVEQITTNDLQTLIRIDSFLENIGDLTGLEYATNLYLIYFEGNPVTNYSALYQLPNLSLLGERSPTSKFWRSIRD
jgi:hypothetical protein